MSNEKSKHSVETMDTVTLFLIIVIFGYIVLYVRGRKYNEGFYVESEINHANGGTSTVIANSESKEKFIVKH
jgi:hypothetical protein